MNLDFELSKNQISQIAQMLYLNLDDIKNYIETHQEEYNEFLKEEEQKENTADEIFTNNNAIWQQYTDDTICNININKNNTKGYE